MPGAPKSSAPAGNGGAAGGGAGPAAGRSGRTARRRAPAAAAILSLLLLAPVAAAPGPAAESDPPAAASERPPLAGLSLTDALLELQARGLKLVFTSQVVRPEMRVGAEPAAVEPRRILDEILAPHGLRAEEGAGGVIAILPAAEARLPGRSLRGTVRVRGTLEPLAGVALRLLETGSGARSGASGRFEIVALEPGDYTLEARLRGFFVEQVAVAVPAAGDGTASLTLQPVPFLHDEIVVRPSRLSLLHEEPAAPLSLSRSEIETLPHLGGDVFRALSLLPGTAANDVSAQFHVHGGRRDEVQILLDGQELYEAFHLKDYDSALSVVAPDGLSSVDLTTGAFPASRGDRMSGVLDMTTATPPGPLRTRLSLALLNASAASGGSFGGERGGWLASARRGAIDLAGRLLGSEDPSFWDLYGKVEARLDDRNRVRLNLLHAADSLDFSETQDGDSKRWNTDYDNSYFWFSHQAGIGRRLLLETTASWSRIDRDRRGVEDEEEQSFEVRDVRAFDVLGLAQSWGLQASPRQSLKWGFEVRRYDAEYDYFNRIEPDFGLSTPLTEPRSPITDFAGEFRGEHLGAYLADRFSPLEPLTLELGLRYDRHTLTDDTLLSPRLNAAWRLGEASVLRAAWGHFHQSQRPYELQVEDGETRFFRAERAEHWVVGYERLLGRRDRAPLRALRIEAYRREIRAPRPRFESLFEPLNTFPEVEPDRVLVAPDSSRAEGVEIVLRGSAGPRLDWWVNYAWAITEDRILGEEVRRQIDQPHTLNLHLNANLGRQWRLNLAWRLHSGWPTTPVSLAVVEGPDGEPELTPVLGPLYSRRLSTYHRMDARVSRHWELRSGQLVFFADVQNLYDRKNQAGFDLALDEEEGVLLVEQERWVGFFPSLGVRWEF